MFWDGGNDDSNNADSDVNNNNTEDNLFGFEEDSHLGDEEGALYVDTEEEITRREAEMRTAGNSGCQSVIALFMIFGVILTTLYN